MSPSQSNLSHVSFPSTHNPSLSIPINNKSLRKLSILMSFTLTDTQAVSAMQLLQQPGFHQDRSLELWIQHVALKTWMKQIAAAPLLRSWVRILPGAWIFVCCECRVLSGRGLCDELITRPEESYRLCCVVVCDLETSRIGAPYIYIYIYIYMTLVT